MFLSCTNVLKKLIISDFLDNIDNILDLPQNNEIKLIHLILSEEYIRKWIILFCEI
jgi:hypothetical protein